MSDVNSLINCLICSLNLPGGLHILPIIIGLGNPPLLDTLFVPPNVHTYLNLSMLRIVIFYQHILLTLVCHCCSYPELCNHIPVIVY